MLRGFLALAAPIILLLGARLLLVPARVASQWPGPLTPLDARFFAVFCLAEFTAIVIFLAVTRWAPGRLIIPSWFAFTALVAAASLLNVRQFNLERPETWFWLILFVGASVLAGLFLWRYRKLPPAHPTQLSAWWRRVLATQAVLVGLYGAVMLVAPAASFMLWPWPIDDFQAQVYSAIFLTNALGAYLLIRAAAAIELLAFGLPQAILGPGSVIAVATMDQGSMWVAWDSPAAWVWSGLLIVLGAAGLGLLWQARRRRLDNVT